LTDEEQMAKRKAVAANPQPNTLKDPGEFLDDANHRLDATQQAETIGMPVDEADVLDIAWKGQGAMPSYSTREDYVPPKAPWFNPNLTAWAHKLEFQPLWSAVSPRLLLQVPRQARVSAILGSSGRLTAGRLALTRGNDGPMPRRHFHAPYMQTGQVGPRVPRAFTGLARGGLGIFRQTGMSKEDLWNLLDKNGDGVITRDEWEVLEGPK